MGIYECDKYGKVMSGISYWCEGCGFGEGDGNILCDDCANEGGCDKCDKSRRFVTNAIKASVCIVWRLAIYLAAV
jgi:hypothetical protein